MTKIKNEIEYNAIITRVDELIKLVNEDTPKENQNYIELDILTDLVIQYEEQIKRI